MILNMGKTFAYILLFIDFKAAYDTIIRNEVYVAMLELEFPTKLIRLTKATLPTVLCCVKIQNGYKQTAQSSTN